MSAAVRVAVDGSPLPGMAGVPFDGFLAEKCGTDKEAFCADVKPGKGRVIRCLESHASDAKFSAECRAILDRRGVRRAADWRLDYVLRKACSGTVKKLCGDAVKAAKAKVSASGGVLECLKSQLADEKIESLEKRLGDDRG